MNKHRYEYYSIFTIVLFVLGFFNILFAWLGFICLITPFLILFRKNKNVWCQSYCPRANLFTVLFKKTKSRPLPKWLSKDWVKDAMLIYFIVNVFILFMSTTMVFLSRMEVMDSVRFMIAFNLPWEMPQVIHIENVPDWAVHLSFRIYSMMFSTTTLGLILGFLYKPRTWCSICPVMTLSNMYLANKKNDLKTQLKKEIVK